MGLVCLALYLYFIVLIARIIFSWVEAFASRPPEGLRPIMRIVYDLTEPVIGPLRRLIPPIGGFDISVIFVFIALRIVQASLGC